MGIYLYPFRQFVGVFFGLCALVAFASCKEEPRSQSAQPPNPGVNYSLPGSTIPDLQSLLPKGDLKTQTMTIQRPEPFQNLWDRFTAAIRSKPQWWQNYMQANAAVNPLPYHKNMGLSEDEYRQLVALTDAGTLVPLHPVSLHVVQRENGNIVLTSKDIPQMSGGIEFSLKDSTITTHLGSFSHPEMVKMVEEGEGGIFGPYLGYRWYHTEGSVESGQGLDFDVTLLQQLSGRRTFLHYRGTRMKNSAVAEQFEFIVELGSA